MKYIYSGGFSPRVVEYLKTFKDYEPVDMLVSQVDRSILKYAISLIDQGIVKSLFVDSGAFSAWTRGINIDIDEYISFVNSIDQYTDMIASLDVIAGKLGYPVSTQDYIEAAEKSWNNYLYMYDKINSPNKLIATYHFGEPIEYLNRILDYRHPDGTSVSYLGIGGLKQTSPKVRDTYLASIFRTIQESSNPNINVHLFAVTDFTNMLKYNPYSVDSTRTLKEAVYGKMFTQKFGYIPVSYKLSCVSDMFLVDADEHNLSILKDIIGGYGFTLEDLSNQYVRAAISIIELQKQLKTQIPVKPRKGPKRLF